ncbi:MAG: divergent polysaccharide deacetylase family protein [Clostridia bacterium]|nr:divergent polysaccharide deacetylase family protein [Clostridia bacterium]
MKFFLVNLSSKYKGIKYFPFILVFLFVLCINIVFFSILNFQHDSSLRLIQSSSGSSKTENEKVKVAIVIDDFGQSRSGIREMMSIDRHLTFAVMPFLTYSQTDAETAYRKGYEVIVHLPMEPNKGKASWLGPRPILTALNDDEVQKIVIDAFESVPLAAGANIHMGSKASENERIMSDILDIIKIKGVYFLDSKTSSKDIARKIAESKGVLFFERDVFLDGTQSKDFIKKRLKQAGEIALKRGYSIAIGHVGTEGGKVTADAILETLSWFDDHNIELVYVSELFSSSVK